MRTVLAAAALSMCFVFAGHAAESQSTARPAPATPGCIQHSFVHVSYMPNAQRTSLGCAQFLSTSRVVQTRHIQHT